MTPLAQRIVENLTLPIALRCKYDDVGLMHKMADVHCFDLTEAWPLIEDLSRKIVEDGADVGRLCFLPAQKTWLEVFGREAGARQGYLLVSSADGASCTAYFATTRVLVDDGTEQTLSAPDYFTSTNVYRFQLLQSAVLPEPSRRDLVVGEPNRAFLYAALALINTPRLIGRRQHMPHRGLERRLLKQQAALGHFPLHAWTEIKLEVTPPEDASGSPSSEAHLTGRKALHFCRAHLRVRNGRVEIVRGHWRGDASLGIKRSRYRVTARSDAMPGALS